MIFSQIISKLYTVLRESPNYSGFSSDEVKGAINDALQNFYRRSDWPFLKRSIFTSNGYTALSAGVSAGATTISVDSVANIPIGSSLVINDETNAEYVTVTSISSLTITITPPLLNAYAVDTTVSSRSIFLPADCLSPKSIIRQPDTDGVYSALALVRQDEKRMTYIHPFPISWGAPKAYIYGAPSTRIISSIVNTTSGTYIGLMLGVAYATDCFKGWTFVDRTQSTASAIVSNTTSSLTLENSIVCNPSDTFDLIDTRTHVVLDPTPDMTYNFIIEYKKENVPDLVNNHDYAIVPDKWIPQIIKAAVAQLKKRENPEFANDNRAEYLNFTEDAQRSAIQDKIFSVAPWGYQDLDDRDI